MLQTNIISSTSNDNNYQHKYKNIVTFRIRTKSIVTFMLSTHKIKKNMLMKNKRTFISGLNQTI